MASIDFIYFDLGKVILDFDHQIGCQKVAELAAISTEQVHQAMFETGLEEKYETGLINCDEFRDSFCESTKSSIGKTDLLTAMSDMFELNVAIMPLITQLSAANFPIGILSNTCRAHWDFVYRRYTILRDYFEPLILSFEVNSMKPDSKIFERAIERAGRQANQCFFVDDKPENVREAIAAGMDAMLYDSVPELVRQLKLRGVALNL